MTFYKGKLTKILIYSFIVSIAIFYSFSKQEVVFAQTTLSQASQNFNVYPYTFGFTSLAGKGIHDSFSVFWTIQQSGPPEPSVGVNCTFIGTSAVDCLPKPFIQASGPGSCTVQYPPQYPPYDFTKLNNVSCLAYYVPDHLFNTTYNISFYPVAFDATAAVGSLTVGRPVPLAVNIQNHGLLTDRYTVNFTSSVSYILFSNPNAVSEYVEGIPINETKQVTSGVTAQAAFGSQTKITIQVNSTVYPSIGKTIVIGLSAGLASLPDFTIFGIIQIIILAALILWAKK